MRFVVLAPLFFALPLLAQTWTQLPDFPGTARDDAAAFNIQEGTNLTEEQGWRFMVQLKYSRACVGMFVADDYEDMAAYAGLAGESAQHG